MPESVLFEAIILVLKDYCESEGSFPSREHLEEMARDYIDHAREGATKGDTGTER